MVICSPSDRTSRVVTPYYKVMTCLVREVTFPRDLGIT